MPHTIFISDLHLDADALAQTAWFVRFMQQLPADTQALYILGDLFEYWIGDDESSNFITEVINTLKNVSQHCPVYLMRGNRDLFLGQEFCRKSGCQLLEDPTRIDLYGTPTLLMHGDLLCSNDQAYQRWRRIIRQPWLQRCLLSLPLRWRRRIAAYLRQKSRGYTRTLSVQQMDATPETIRHFLESWQVQQIIHGHTHQPSIHYFIYKGRPYWRYVLSDWHRQANALIVSPDQPPKLVYFN